MSSQSVNVVLNISRAKQSSVLMHFGLQTLSVTRLWIRIEGFDAVRQHCCSRQTKAVKIKQKSFVLTQISCQKTEASLFHPFPWLSILFPSLLSAPALTNALLPAAFIIKEKPSQSANISVNPRCCRGLSFPLGVRDACSLLSFNQYLHVESCKPHSSNSCYKNSSLVSFLPAGLLKYKPANACWRAH